ncbi:MAG: leucyl aminopeptidase [Acidobacteria bacterium]|nr:leucyl aminopeptidase [Acidobacteriota bacterium]
MTPILIWQSAESISTEALAIVVFEKDAGQEVPGDDLFRRFDALTEGLLGELYRAGECTGKMLDAVLLHRPRGLAARRLLLVGGGKREKFNSAELRKAAGAVLRCLKGRGVHEFAFLPAGRLPLARQIAAAVEGLLAADFEPDTYKTDKKDDKRIDRVSIVAGSSPEAASDKVDAALERAVTVTQAQNFARELINEPANHLTPSELVARAQKTAVDCGLDFDVLDAERMQALKMGALLGVAQGSAEPPALIVLRYRPAAVPSSNTHLGLVGKAVTFDSGGISIKPAEGMEKMKYDMAGGATMIAVMRALAALKPSIRVSAFIPTVENMPGSRAQRPGDIQTTMSGKTVEVINTDAEGRLILADALTYARKQGCSHLIDAATLTGAIVVALGHTNVGVFSNDQAFLDQVLASAKECGEKMWPMPLDDEYKDQLKSIIADLPNTGSRWGGAITAAMFLKEFADTTPWVHLDIAGTAWLEEAKPYMPKGPSGVAVRTLIDVAMDM